MPKTVERVFRGAALLSALIAYADSAEGKVRQAFLKAIADFTQEGDLPVILDQFQRGEITVEQLPPRIDALEMNADEIRTLVGQAVRGGGTITAKKAQLEMDWDVTQPEVLAAARDLTAKTITAINNTTRKALSDLIFDAIDSGMERDELIRKIKGMVGLLPSHVTAVGRYEQMLLDKGTARRQVNKLVGSYTKRLLDYRARMIGRTEVALAMNAGQTQFWDQMQKKGMLPWNVQRQWMTADDERVCDICGPMDGGLSPIGGVWETLVGPVQVPTDSHPNCRCAMGLVFPDWDKMPGLEKIFKFNPYHDAEGRFTSAGAAFTIGAMPASMRGTAGHVAALASAAGGFTYSHKRGEFRRSGFAVSPFPQHEATFSLDEWARSGPELVKKYMADKSDVLRQPNAHVGGWKGEDRQGQVRIYLDVSVVRNDSKSAANLARRHSQIAYYDLSTFTPMRRKQDDLYYSYSDDSGTFLDPDEIGKAVTRQGGVYFIAPRYARDPQALLTFVNAISDSQPVLMGSALSKFNPYHDAAGRFSSADQAASGWGANDWRNELPASPGTTPVPEGALRLWHYTSDSALDSIEQAGLQMTSARGESYGEPNLIWGSAQTPDFSVIDTRPQIEFYVLPEEVDIGRPNVGENSKAWADRLTRAGAHVTTTTDIEPSRIIIHHKWHRAARYMEREILAEVLAGEHDNLVGDENYAHYGKAIEYLKTKHGVSKFNPYHDATGRFTSANAAATISGGALGANRGLAAEMLSYVPGMTAAGVQQILGTEEGLLRYAVSGGAGPVVAESTRTWASGGPAKTEINLSDKNRGIVKVKGAEVVAAEMTTTESDLAEVLARTLAHHELEAGNEPWANKFQGTPAEMLTQHMQNQWAHTAGDSNPDALAVQIAAAHNAGWSQKQIDERVFYDLSPKEITVARQIAEHVISKAEGSSYNEYTSQLLWAGREWNDSIEVAIKELGVRPPSDMVPRPGDSKAMIALAAATNKMRTMDANVLVAARTLALDAVTSEGYRAVLSAEQRASFKMIDRSGSDSTTVTLYRGVKYRRAEWQDDPISNEARLRSQSAPLTAWSVSKGVAQQFSGYGTEGGVSYVLRADVPVSTIVGLSGLGFGCLQEGEVIVGPSEFDVEVVGGSGFTGTKGVRKALPTINFDELLHNQDWTKQTPDTYEALGLSVGISKFNPYHDELGRFTSAGASATIGGGPLGANRELTVSIMERALGRSLTDPEMTAIREAAERQLFVARQRQEEFGAVRAHVTTGGVKGTTIVAREEVRRETKQQGARTITEEMTPDELAACGAAMRLQGQEEQTFQRQGAGVEKLAQNFVAEQNNLWAETAGDSKPEALAVQVSAAEMQGWDDQKIADRVFRKTSRQEVAAAREIAKLVLKDNDPEVLLGGWFERSNAIEEAARAIGHDDKARFGRANAATQVVAQTFIYSELLGDAHKAVLAANQRVAQKMIKAAVGDASTVSLFRGVQMEPYDNYDSPEKTFPTGGKVRSQSSPLSSWSVSYQEASKFAEGGVVLRADVPVSSIVGSCAVGFGCLPEGEMIVSGASFDATVIGEVRGTSGDTGWAYSKLDKAILTINLDATDINQDWPKRTPDTYAALGLPSPISKFNPYHDERGRFTSANAGATISGGALGANRELTISMVESALGPLTDSKKTLLRDVPTGAIDFVGLGGFDISGVSHHPGISMDARVAINTTDRGKLKQRGAKAIVKELEHDELKAVFAAVELQGKGVPTQAVIDEIAEQGFEISSRVEQFVAEQNNLWAGTAGDSRPEALAVQVAAAEMQGWNDQKIGDRVFRETSRQDLATAREIAKRVIENARASDAMFTEKYQMPPRAIATLVDYTDKGLEQAVRTEWLKIKSEESGGKPHVFTQIGASLTIAAQTFVRSELLGDAHKAVLASGQRVSQRILKESVGDAPTITLFRGVRGIYSDNWDQGIPPTGAEIRSQSSPLSSWSVSYNATLQFAGGRHGITRGDGYVLQADVPVSSIAGLSSTGFGCVIEGEVIVNGDSFTATVVPPKGFPSGEPFSVEKAILTINLDSTDINQDWPKRTPDTYAALGLPSPIAKFNPYHDAAGRFTSAGGDAYGGDTDRFTWAGSDLQDSPLQNKGAAVTQEFPGHYKVEYGDLVETVTDERGAGFAEEGNTHWGMWEGNYQMRNASAALMGLTPPKAKGGDDPRADPNMNEAYATGYVEGLTAIDQQNMARDIHTVNKVVREVSQASEDAPLLHRGLTDVDPDSHLLTAPIGSTYVTPLTAYSSDPAVALRFTADDQSAHRPEVMVIVKPGSKAVHGGEDTFYEYDAYRAATGWVKNDYGPVEHVSQGRYRIVDRIESVGRVSRHDRGGIGHYAEAPITTVIVEQVSTHGGSGSGWRDNKNEADALPPGMTEGLASDVRQLEMFEGDLYKAQDVIPDWVWAMAGSLASGQVKKFNPYHDERGRFTSAGGAGAAGGATTYTGGRGYWEGTIEVTDYNGEPRLLSSIVDDGLIDREGAIALAQEVFDVELKLKTISGREITVTAEIKDQDETSQSMIGGVRVTNAPERIAVSGTLYVQRGAIESLGAPEGEREYAGRFDATIAPDGSGLVVAGDVFGPPPDEQGFTVKDGKPLAQIGNLFLNESVQQIGVGTALMAHWEDQLARTGVDRMTIHAVSNDAGMSGGYTWLKYGYTPSRTSVDNMVTNFITEAALFEDGLADDWGVDLSGESATKLSRMLGLSSSGPGPTSADELWEWHRAADPTHYDSFDYEGIYGSDVVPLLEEIPEFKGWALDNADWRGSKKLEVIEKAATPALSPQIEATIRVANRWMRENPAGLENDDDAFWAEVAEARTSAPIKKFNPNHDELGRFSSGPGGGVPAGPKRGQPHTAKRKPSRLGMTGEPNPVTGTIMSNTEFGDTMETLFRQRAGRQAGFKKMFGGRLRALAGQGEQVRTGALDYRTDTFGIEVKSLNTRAKDKRVKIARRAAAAKRLEAERMGLKGGIAVQVVDFDRGSVTLYGWDKGFSNPSAKASPTSVNIQFSPLTQGEKVGEYRFTRAQWHEAQKQTTRMDNKGRLKGTWGAYEPPDTMGKMDDLAWRVELRKVRDDANPLLRPDAVQRLMKDREAPMTDEGERIEAGDTVIQLVEQEGKWVPHIYEAE